MSDIACIREELLQKPAVRLRIMASPGKSRSAVKKVLQTEVRGEYIWILYVDVAAQPVHGDANKELCTFLSKLFVGYKVTLSSGRTSREKYFQISN